MKKLFLSAIAVPLIFSGWQAAAVPTSGTGVFYAAGDSAKPAKKAKKAKKDKKADKGKTAGKKDTKTTKDKPAKKDKKGKKGEVQLSGAVAEYLQNVTFFNGKPNLGAKYFIYLQSASWCGPCNMEMPHIVEQYKEMKEDGRVELILVGHDRTEEKAKGFLTQYNAEFPGILATDPAVSSLPGFAKANGIPNAIIVDADGAVIYKGHPGPLFSRKEWKVRTIDKE